MKKLIGIVAMTPSQVIGMGGTLPWHLPEDLAFFKRTTSGHPILMGRKTYESIGRPLPKRRNIILTRDAGWSAPGIEIIHSPSELEAEGEVYIIGGAQIYSALLDQMDELLVSHVHHDYPGDTRFPEFTHLFPVRELVESHADFEVYRYLRN